MRESDYKKLYNAIFDNIPDFELDKSAFNNSWTGVDTSFGCGLALNNGFNEQSLKLACSNSYFNRGDNYYLPFEQYYADIIDFKDKTVGIIGHMTGVSKRYGDVCKKIYTFDCENEEDLPPEKEDEFLPLCDIVIITGSTIQNGTLPHILSICENSYRVLTGPSVPQCINLLDFKIDMLAGMCVNDKNMMFEFIEKEKPGSPYGFGLPFRVTR